MHDNRTQIEISLPHPFPSLLYPPFSMKFFTILPLHHHHNIIYPTGNKTSKAPVPHPPTLPTTILALGPFKSSQSPSSTASLKNPTVVSKLIFIKGLVVPLRPVRLKGVKPPPRVMTSAMRFRWRRSTAMLWPLNTDSISRMIVARAASTPYSCSIA